MRRTQKGQKFKNTQQQQKNAKWHGNEEQMNIYVYHMLNSCGVQARSYPKAKVKLNSSTWPQKSYLDFEILGSIFLKLDYHQ